MSIRTRDERLQLQDLDDGAPDDTVYRLTRWTYHDTLECTRLAGRDLEDVDPETRAHAQRCWAGPCQQCVLGEDDTDGDSP